MAKYTAPSAIFAHRKPKILAVVCTGWSADNAQSRVERAGEIGRGGGEVKPRRLLLPPGVPYLPQWKPFREATLSEILLVAACALVDVDGRVLIGKRPHGKSLAGMWEFPGGKVEKGETPEACLVRELAEELGIIVTNACLSPLTFTSHGYDSFHLIMPLYVCRRWEGFASAREHEAIAWVRPTRLQDYPMPPADRPLVAWLCDLL